MNTTDTCKSDVQHKPAELNTEEIAQVSGGRQILVDGMLLEMSDHSIATLVHTAARQITVKGVAYPGSQREEW